MFQYESRSVSFAHKVDFASFPKDEFYKHMHPFFEVIYLVEGSVEFHLETNTRHLLPGDVVLIQPGKFHFAVVDHDHRYERYVFKVPEDYLPPHLVKNLAKAEPFFPDCSSMLPVFQEFDRYAEQYEGDDLYALCAARMTEILVLLSKHPGAPTPSQEAPTIAQEIVAYVEEHISERMTLETVAKALHYSPSYVATAFKAEMHVPLMQYVRSKKVHASLALINHGTRPQEAAAQMGFADYSTFYRCYIKVLGKRPSEVKKDKLLTDSDED